MAAMVLIIKYLSEVSIYLYLKLSLSLGILLIICSLNSSYFYQSKNVTSILVVIVLGICV